MDWLTREMLQYEIKPEIEAFDLSHIHHAAKMNREGYIPGRLYVQFVMGFKNAMPANKDVFDHYVKTVRRLLPDADWCGAGMGAQPIKLNQWSIASGGHVRTGLEDDIQLDKHTLAPSNAALVKRAVDLCDQYDRPLATRQQARTMLDLRVA